MLISASRRTDVPAFHGDWFMRRVREGFVEVANPFNPKQVKRHSLLLEDVDAFVFWTKNPRHFFSHLDELDERGYHYLFQFTLNDYPRLLEPSMEPFERRVETFLDLSDRIGPHRVLWRYDPIVISSLTPWDYHVERIGRTAERLRGHTERLTVSFVDFYGKVKKRFRRLSEAESVTFTDVHEEACDAELERLCGFLRETGGRNGLAVSSCSEKADLNRFGIPPGACIDGELIKRVFSLEKHFPRDSHQRKECLCAKSADIGAYDTCPAGCVYCYGC